MLTKFEARALVELTTDIYRAVCKELGHDPDNKAFKLLWAKAESQVVKEVGAAYRMAICRLDWRTLELILMAHEQGFTKRRQETIHAIQGELVERGLLNEGQDKETQ